MRLTRIELENFKSIGARQTIDLQPITLLFGPNSAGKEHDPAGAALSARNP